MTAAVAARTRVVVAVDEAEPSAVSLDIARGLFDAAATDLVGVFVEDQRLFAHAASRLAREVGFSGESRSFDAPTLERQLRASAREARRRFEEAATRLGVKHEFQVLRGDFAAELLQQAARAEALIVGLARREPLGLRQWRAVLRALIAAPVPAVLLAHEGWRTGRDIVAMIERTEDTPTALATALRLAQRSRSSVTLLQRARSEAERSAIAEVATRLAAAMNVDLRALVATAITAEALPRAIRGARLLVLPHRERPDEIELFATLAARAATPLLLVGAAADSPAGSTRRRG